MAEGLGEVARGAKIPYYQTRVGVGLGGFLTDGLLPIMQVLKNPTLILTPNFSTVFSKAA